MKVGNRLSLFCSLVFGVIFAIISLLIYVVYHNNAEKSIYKGLKKNAYISAFFYLEEDELNAKEFEKIRLQFEEVVPTSSFQIYDAENIVRFGDNSTQISDEVLNEIRLVNDLKFKINDRILYGVFYEDNQGDFVIVTREDNEALNEQMNLLFSILLVSFFIGILMIVVLSRWVSHVAYRPFSDVINQVQKISMNKLDVQIESPLTKDELQDLTDTFNDLLARISETFLIQKNFVSYVSHEFRTPLTSVLGNLEVFSIKERTSEEYQVLSEKLIKDIHQLEEILDTLLIVSDLKDNADLEVKIRIDELIWEIVDKLKSRYTDAKLHVDITLSTDNDYLLFVQKDRTQLYMAILNIVENAIKYSKNKSASIQISEIDKKLCISISDNGIGVPAEQLEYINKPFYRGYNTERIQGTGIGLSIALRILEKNGVICSIESEVGKGTSVMLQF